MDINNLQRTPSYSYQIDVDRIKQSLQQADKNSVSNQRQSDSVDISEKGRMALREKMSAISKENVEMLKQKTDSLNHFSLNLGVSSSARNVLNGIWDYYANMKQ